MLKGGAEGVYCGSVRDKGWGFALKIDDGHAAAARALVAALLLAIADPDSGAKALLERYASQPIRNVRGREVGTLAAQREAIAATFA